MKRLKHYLIIALALLFPIFAYATNCTTKSQCLCSINQPCNITMDPYMEGQLAIYGFIKDKHYICNFEGLHCNNTGDIKKLALGKLTIKDSIKVSFTNPTSNKLYNNSLIVDASGVTHPLSGFSGNLSNSNIAAQCFVSIACHPIGE